MLTFIIIVMMQSIQPKLLAIAVVCQNSLSSAGCMALVAVTPMIWRIWWIQVVVGLGAD